MNTNYCKEDGFDKITPCELSEYNLVLVIVANEPEHAEVM